ncbi:MAG: triple tyrosine motif-containing protein [Bacteroidota bacterium]
MKSPSQLWFLYFLLVVPACLKGQQNLYKQWAWHALQPEQGLSQGSNEYIFRDSEDFLWISSLDGLNRFDGQTVKVYKADPSDSTSLLGNIITSHFFEDQAQNIWFSTYEGIQCYQRQTDQLSSLQIPRETGFYQQDYQLIYLENDRLLWFRIGVGSDARLWKYDLVTLKATSITTLHGQRFIPLANTHGELQQIIACLLPNRPGFELLNLTTLHTDTLFADSSIGQVHDVLPAERGYWIGAENGFYSYDHYYDRLEQHTLNFDPPLGNIFSIKPFDEHTLVLSSAKEGLLFFDISAKYLYRVPSPKRGEPYSIPLDQVNKIYLDEQGTVWLSSFREGIAYATPEKIKFKHDPYLEGQSITALLEWNGGGGFINLVSVRGKGLILAEQGGEPWYLRTHFPSEQKEETIKALFAGEEETIWALSSHYLFRSQSLFQEGFQTLASLPAPFLARTTLANGQQLIATYEGVFSVDLSTSPPTFASYQSLNQWQSALVTAFYEDAKGRLYLAVDASRLLILQPSPTGYQLLKTVEGTGYAKAFLEQGDTLWIATSNGLLSLDNTSLKTHLLQAKDGIPAEHFYSVLPGRDRSLWLSSNQGIWQYFPGQKRSVQYTIIDGIQGLEFNTDAFLLNSRGLIWLGGTQGLNYFDPATIEPWPKTPTIQWTGLSINDEAVSLPYSIASLETLDLPYQENTLSFSFVGIEYSDPPRNQLRYRLLPIEECWVQLGAEGFARYSNLPPGRYTFEVQGANPEGIWTKTSKQIQLRIRTPW